MSRPILAQVTLPSRTGFAKHNVVNTFAIDAFDAFEGDATDLGEVTIPIANFYIAAPVAADKVGAYISNSISRDASACKIRLYDVADLTGEDNMGSPFAIDSFTLPAANTNNSLPSEVACVLTTRVQNYTQLFAEAPDGPDAGVKVDRPRQRGTGRIYNGPLTILANDTDANGHSRPLPAYTTALRNAANRLRDELAVGGHVWSVWSRVNASMTPIHTVQTDDAWDTQRRRGLDAVTRTSLVVE